MEIYEEMNAFDFFCEDAEKEGKEVCTPCGSIPALVRNKNCKVFYMHKKKCVKQKNVSVKMYILIQ